MELTLFVSLMCCSAALVSANGISSCIANNLNFTVTNRHVDVMELLDSSGSVQPAGYDDGLSALQEMNGIINGISAPPGINGGMPAPGSRVGFVKFSHPLLTGIEIELPTYTSVGWLNSVMGIFPFDNGGWTAMTSALQLANIHFAMFSSSPPRNKRVWLVTDGNNNVGGNPTFAADTLKSWGTHICVVAIGNSVNIPVLNQIASTGYNGVPCVCTTSSFKKFKKGVKNAAKLLKKATKKRKG